MTGPTSIWQALDFQCSESFWRLVLSQMLGSIKGCAKPESRAPAARDLVSGMGGVDS